MTHSWAQGHPPYDRRRSDEYVNIKILKVSHIFVGKDDREPNMTILA